RPGSHPEQTSSRQIHWEQSSLYYSPTRGLKKGRDMARRVWSHPDLRLAGTEDEGPGDERVGAGRVMEGGGGRSVPPIPRLPRYGPVRGVFRRSSKSARASCHSSRLSLSSQSS